MGAAACIIYLYIYTYIYLLYWKINLHDRYKLKLNKTVKLMRQQLCLSFKVQASMFSHATTLVTRQETEQHSRNIVALFPVKGQVPLVHLGASLIFLVTTFFRLVKILALSSENLWNVALVCSWMAELVGCLPSVCLQNW